MVLKVPNVLVVRLKIKLMALSADMVPNVLVVNYKAINLIQTNVSVVKIKIEPIDIDICQLK